ncbi:MAG: hypothetical protein V7739_10340 [Motiliproteus sp.]
MNTYKVVGGALAIGVLVFAFVGLNAPQLTGTKSAAVKTDVVNIASILGTWKTRTVADDDLNGAYSGKILFGKSFYEIQNDLVQTPIRIDGVIYTVEGNKIDLIVAGNRSSTVTILNKAAATINLSAKDNLVLYLYR